MKLIFRFHILFLTFIIFLIAGNADGQTWNFIKEKDGIKIYTRNEEDNPIKSFKGEVDLKTTMEKLSHVIGRIESFDWWADDVKEIKVLGYEEEKYIRYYVIYDVPWPLSDRDLCVEALITNDPVTGMRTVRATPMAGVIPEEKDLVRINNYWQQWTMEPVGDGLVHVVLEGSVDPGGAIPNWIVNMLISDTPLSIIRKVREQVEVK